MKTGIKNKQNSWAFLKNCMPRAQRCRSVCHLFGNPGDLESVSSKNQESLRWRQNQSGRLWLRTGILVGLVVTERSEIYSLDCNNIRTLIQHKAYIYIYMYYMPYVRYMYIWWYKSLHALTTSFPWLSWSIQKINWTGAIRDTLQWINISHLKVAKRSRWFFSSGFGCFCTNPRPPKVGSLDSWWSDSSVNLTCENPWDFWRFLHTESQKTSNFWYICNHLRTSSEKSRNDRKKAGTLQMVP